MHKKRMLAIGLLVGLGIAAMASGCATNDAKLYPPMTKKEIYHELA